MEGIECYKRIDNPEDLTGFVKEHSALINKIARFIKFKSPAHVELDDLIQSGIIGLLEAKNGFSPDAGASFATYASIKVRFAIFEYLRKSSGVTRDISQNIKKMAAAVTKIENNETELLSTKNIANKMGVTLEQYSDIISEINAVHALSFNEIEQFHQIPCEKTDNPLLSLETESTKNLIKATIMSLPQREAIILSLYYTEQLNFKEIAEIMDLSEARISQIHSSTITKLKQKITSLEGTLI